MKRVQTMIKSESFTQKKLVVIVKINSLKTVLLILIIVKVDTHIRIVTQNLNKKILILKKAILNLGKAYQILRKKIMF